MNKPSIEEWARDCSKIGYASGRFANANAHLSQHEADEAYAKMKAVVMTFANKYGMSHKTAQSIADIVSSSVSL